MKKNACLFSCLLALFMLSSCDDDEKETNPPIVTIDAPAGSNVLKGTVTISASATDESEVASIKILVDDNAVQEESGGSISFEWNTSTVSDGDHTIEVIATDVVGNAGSATATVKTFNDKKAPVVSISAPSDAPFVKSTIKISGVIEDDSEIASVKAFIDDVAVSSLPNAKTFSFDWDTKTIPDGIHTIRILAVDDRGNESSAIKQVNVFNYFLTLKVVNPLVPSHVKVWYIVSKTDGTLIKALPYEEGATKIQFETPDNFNAEDRYVLSTLNHMGKYENYLIQTNLYTQMGVAPGEITVRPSFAYSTSFSATEVGRHKLRVGNVPEYKQLFTLGLNAYSYSVSNDSLVLNLIYYNPNALSPFVAVLRNADETPRFKSFSGLQIGGLTSTSFNDFTPMVGKTVPAYSGATFTYGNVFGVNDSKYDESNLLWRYNSSFMDPAPKHYLYYPDGQYSEYLFSVGDGEPGQNYFFLNVGTEAPSTILRCDAAVSSFNKTGRSISLNTSGSYDIVSISGSTQKNIDTDLHVYFWYVEFPDGNSHSLTLPKLPAELDVYEFPDTETLSFNNVSFTDYTGLSGYKAVRNFNIDHPGVNIYSVSKTLLNKNVTLNNASGRMKNEPYTETQKILMQNNKIMGLSPFYLR